MKFGIFYELQYPRPWEPGGEQQLFNEALDQIELGDKIGIDYMWATEHHFLEEYAHSSAPECFLAAASQRTKKMRLGHSVALLPPAYNHPARVAERIATLDILSNGRIEFGTGESAGTLELEAFGLNVDDKRDHWLECIEEVSNMLAMDPYPGFSGKSFSMPPRNVVPKPVQKAHPPLWVACSNRETIKLAARLGIGALTFSFIEAAEAKRWVDEYYEIFRTECVPIGHTVNPNIALFTGFGVHRDHDEALRRFVDGIRFFQFGINHYYRSGAHVPGQTDIWANYINQPDQVRSMDFDANNFHIATSRGAIGSVEMVRERVRSFAEAGIDQLVFIQQGGKNKHAEICESLELFASEIMPEFRQGDEERQAKKMAELQPYIEAAFARKEKLGKKRVAQPIEAVKTINYVLKYDAETATLGMRQSDVEAMQGASSE